LGGAFTTEDAELLETFAAHVANAIEIGLTIDALKKEQGSSEPKASSGTRASLICAISLG